MLKAESTFVRSPTFFIFFPQESSMWSRPEGLFRLKFRPNLIRLRLQLGEQRV